MGEAILVESSPENSLLQRRPEAAVTQQSRDPLARLASPPAPAPGPAPAAPEEARAPGADGEPDVGADEDEDEASKGQKKRKGGAEDGKPDKAQKSKSPKQVEASQWKSAMELKVQLCEALEGYQHLKQCIGEQAPWAWANTPATLQPLENAALQVEQIKRQNQWWMLWSLTKTAEFQRAAKEQFVGVGENVSNLDEIPAKLKIVQKLKDKVDGVNKSHMQMHGLSH